MHRHCLCLLRHFTLAPNTEQENPSAETGVNKRYFLVLPKTSKISTSGDARLSVLSGWPYVFIPMKRRDFGSFGYLKSTSIVAGESGFSEHWLGCSEGYMRELRHKKTEPSLGAVAICASRLMCAAEQLRTLPCYQPLAKQLASTRVTCRSLAVGVCAPFVCNGQRKSRSSTAAPAHSALKFSGY